jgi:hypothetical protein
MLSRHSPPTTLIVLAIANTKTNGGLCALPSVVRLVYHSRQLLDYAPLPRNFGLKISFLF